ncbi:MAG: hypothetical protein ACQESR_20060 [Planctomycetota bacterium]
MSNRHRFIRRAAAVLLACGLIAGLLPSFAAAQDLSTQGARSARLVGQFRGARISPNGKFAGGAALARLAPNPDDDEVIDKITHFYDNVPEGSNGEQFTYSAVASVLGKYWDKFSPTQRDHLKAKLKGFNDLLGHGTENHATMKGAAAYPFAQYWPNKTGWAGGQYSREQVAQVSRGCLAWETGVAKRAGASECRHNQPLTT